MNQIILGIIYMRLIWCTYVPVKYYSGIYRLGSTGEPWINPDPVDPSYDLIKETVKSPAVSNANNVGREIVSWLCHGKRKMEVR
jgi:hypothetical protein